MSFTKLLCFSGESLKLRRFTLTVVLMFVSSASIAKDITSLVKRNSNLDENIAQFCKDYCQGNERKGKLESFDVSKTPQDDQYAIAAKAKLRNKHDTGFAILYSFTMVVSALGTLDSRSCNLTIESVEVEDDRLGLTSLARELEGETYQVENCKDFLTDVD